jgi:hypothetical protein
VEQHVQNGLFHPAFLLLLPAFLVVWCGTCYLNSLIIGWSRMAERFASNAGPVGEMRSANAFPYTVYWRGWAHYSWIVRLTAASDGLYLSVIAPFRPGHPPLRIPWNEIVFGRARFLFRSYVELRLGNEEKIPLRISERMAGKLGILERVPA